MLFNYVGCVMGSGLAVAFVMTINYISSRVSDMLTAVLECRHLYGFIFFDISICLKYLFATIFL